MTSLPTINGHNSWSPLEEVWLGDVYPTSWYDHLEPQVKDIFYQLTEKTKEDLLSIENLLTSMNIKVVRPVYDRIEKYLNKKDNLLKPHICPRDHNIVIGNTLYRVDLGPRDPWEHAINAYKKDNRCKVEWAPAPCITGANVVRVGKDIIVDREWDKNYQYQNNWPDHRIQVVDNGGHLDSCFAILKPGLILANRYYQDYDTTFPGWEVIYLNNPTYHRHEQNSGSNNPAYPRFNGKFWDTTVGTNRSFNQHVIDHALSWVGMYTETYFELNCLVIDTENVIMLESNEQLAEDLAKHGIKVHWVPFRTRSFWDGAMHCLTVDIRRQSKIEDFFPDRSS